MWLPENVVVNSTDVRFERILENTVKFFLAYKTEKHLAIFCSLFWRHSANSTCTFWLDKSVSIKHCVHQLGLEKGSRLRQASATNSITNERTWFQKSEFLLVCSGGCKHVIGPLWICTDCLLSWLSPQITFSSVTNDIGCLCAWQSNRTLSFGSCGSSSVTRHPFPNLLLSHVSSTYLD